MRTFLRRRDGYNLPKSSCSPAVTKLSFSTTCSQTTFGMALVSLVLAVSLNAERSALDANDGSIWCTQQQEARIFAVVSSP